MSVCCDLEAFPKFFIYRYLCNNIYILTFVIDTITCTNNKETVLLVLKKGFIGFKSSTVRYCPSRLQMVKTALASL